MPNINIGGIVKGTVTGVETFGIFISFDFGYTGLIHISEISDKFVKSVYDYAKVNDEIYSKIIEIDKTNKKLKLSIKNFNYRTGVDNDNVDVNGFCPLRKMLPLWIQEFIKNNED